MKSDSDSPYSLWPDPLPTLEVSPETLQKMQDLLDSPPPPSPELRAAYERYKHYCANLNPLPKTNKETK